MKRIDLTGRRFGKWTVVGIGERIASGPQTRLGWTCRCECGVERSVLPASLTHGKSTGCGECDRYLRRRTHGRTNTRAYRIWASMRERCLNPNNPCFHHYGGRGIRVCGEWVNSFEAFIEAMGDPDAGMTLDRVDNSKGYYRENCRWASRKTQSRNRRDNLLITHNGETLCVADWAEKVGLAYSALIYRIKQGWPVAEALRRPSMKQQLCKT